MPVSWGHAAAVARAIQSSAGEGSQREGQSVNKIPLRKGAPLISQQSQLSREGGKGKQRGAEVACGGSEGGSGAGLPAGGSRRRAGAVSCRAMLCYACTFTHAQPLPGFPKPSLAVAVLALAQALLCSDLAVCSHRKGKPGPM